MTGRYEPKVIGFLCNWCSYEGADAAGRARAQHPSNFTPIRVMCSGRVDPQFILDAFANGADGVLVLACHPGDCHYKNGNHNAMRRNVFLKKLLEQLGIEPERLRLDWVSASEGQRYSKVVTEMVEQVRALGPREYSPDAVHTEPEATAEQISASKLEPASGQAPASEREEVREQGSGEGPENGPAQTWRTT